MKQRNSNPPANAIRVLRYFYKSSQDPLTGDLIERFHEGKTRAWFWKQVLIAIAVRLASDVTSRWMCFAYALAGTLAPLLAWRTVDQSFSFIKAGWAPLPWPWSQLLFELTPIALLALAALPVLVFGLITTHSFRWTSLLRTALINVSLVTLGHHLIDFMPWLLQPIPGHPRYRVLIIPPPVQIAFVFTTFLASAWLGCRSPQAIPPKERSTPTNP